MPGVGLTTNGARLVATCLLVAAVASLAAGCSDTELARERFASMYTCPEERGTVALRKDLKAVDLMLRPEQPPRAIAADPGRLEMWSREQARKAADWDGKSVVDARGCGQQVLLVCGNLRVSVGAQQRGCRTVSYPPVLESR